MLLVARRTGRLAAPLQDAAGAALGDRLLLLGGLTAADTSSAGVLLAGPTRDRPLGSLPVALHDAAAVRLGQAAYLFGGGDGTEQLDAILRIDAPGRVVRVGRLPAPSSDQAAAAVGGTAYVVGGYTGSRWLDTIVAWRPGEPARVVARLPWPLRYAAVAAVPGGVVVAGGSLPDGSASSAVLEYQPRSGRVVRLATLTTPTTHAAAATLRGVTYVIGGRGAVPGTPTWAVVAVDPHAGTVRPAARLPSALSDATAVALGHRILVAGGRGTAGTVDSLLELARPVLRTERRPAAIRSVYAADGANMLDPRVRQDPPRVYVPESLGNELAVIDPRSYRVVARFPTGSLPQHVTPAWDLRTLYVLNDTGNSLTPIDPATARPGRPIRVRDPYNLYFTVDGRSAIVVAEALARLDFRDPHTFRLQHSLHVPCSGVDHMDFSGDGSYAIVSCEFSGQLLEVDMRRKRLLRTLRLPDGARGMPQDVKVAPDGRLFYVADQHANGLWVVDGATFRVTGFLPTGLGVHGLYPSRDGTLLYASNRGEGSISVISFRTRRAIAKWRIPGGGSPDMGGVSADGKVLWLTGRYDSAVYAISTRNGRLLARIPVGPGPHGLCVWPQPGRFSLGHTGILR